MTKPTQVLGLMSQPPRDYEVRRELEHLHKALNDRLVASTAADLKVDYEAGDLGTAAEIATALNLTNAKINVILAKIRLDG